MNMIAFVHKMIFILITIVSIRYINAYRNEN